VNVSLRDLVFKVMVEVYFRHDLKKKIKNPSFKRFRGWKRLDYRVNWPTSPEFLCQCTNCKALYGSSRTLREMHFVNTLSFEEFEEFIRDYKLKPKPYNVNWKELKDKDGSFLFNSPAIDFGCISPTGFIGLDTIQAYVTPIPPEMPKGEADQRELWDFVYETVMARYAPGVTLLDREKRYSPWGPSK